MATSQMVRTWLIAAVSALASAFLSLSVLPAIASPQGSDGLNGSTLKQMIEGLGYEVKTLNDTAGKEKYEFTLTKDDIDVPVAAEVSPSKNYIWLTVYLGDAPKDTEPASKFAAFLKSNSRIQPTMFYITQSNHLMMGITIENRSVTPALFRRVVDKIVGDVVSTFELWGKKG